MSTHTPGPWTLAEATATIPIKGANGKTVASVRYGPTDLDDARLIAAAPELLAACEAWIDWRERLAGKDATRTSAEHGMKLHADMVAAIAKAKGRS